MTNSGAGLLGAVGAFPVLALAPLELAAWLLAALAAVLLLAVFLLELAPVWLVRLLAKILTSTIWRLRVLGRENVPKEGPALLIPNHVSFLDGFLIGVALRRPVRFLVEKAWFERGAFRSLLRKLGAIPISSDEGPKATLRALQTAGDHLDKGELVCIFAEGQLTRTGVLLPFRRGLERIVKGRQAPIVPVYLHGLWGSLFSFEGGRFVTKWPRRIPYPVTLAFGRPLAATTPIWQVRLAVQELGAEVWGVEQDARGALHRGLVRVARRRPLALLFTDASERRVRRLQALAGAVALARALRAEWRDQATVGVFLPPSCPAAIVNLAASLAGRTSVNLNYTVGTASLESAARQAALQTVVTSRAFLDKAGLALPRGARPVFLEDVAPRIGAGAKLGALWRAAFLTVPALERACGSQRRVASGDVATVIFSSGSTGEPKGVVLTHKNVGANVEAAMQVFRLDRRDRLLGILPMFHSFGYLLLWAAATRGYATAFLPNPLDVALIGRTVQRERLSLLLATPTFLQIYARRVPPSQFGSLRLVVAGAEKLPERIAVLFEDTFGVRPLEGYGTTECAPVVAVSVPDFRAPGFFQPGSRRGSVGQPLPGVAVRVVDPDHFTPLPPGAPGMLLVRGPNVMQGYLGRPDLTAAAFRDGWYVTGDIALLDDDGFVRITDRLSRFAKIGGEMVPHGRVEEALQEAAGEDVQVFAVTSVPDDRRGERLAVLHTLVETRLPQVLERLGTMGLPNLFLPRLDDFVRVEALPILGTGKLDLRAVRLQALAALAGRTGDDE